MALTLAEVEHVATLARLGLSDSERETLREQLSSILDHIAVLGQIDTEQIPPTAQVNHLVNVLREDVIEPSLDQAAVLAIAPQSRDGFLEVRAVLGEGSGEAPTA